MRQYIREVTTDSIKHSMDIVRNPLQIPAEADLSVSYYAVQGDSVLSILFGGLYYFVFHNMFESMLISQQGAFMMLALNTVRLLL